MMSGGVASASRLSITGIVASRSSRATSPSTVLKATGVWPRLSSPAAMSRTYNSEPARLSRVLLVISTVRPPIGLPLCVIHQRICKWQDVFAVTDHAAIVTFRYLFLAIPLIEGRLLNKIICANSADDRAQSLELERRT